MDLKDSVRQRSCKGGLCEWILLIKSTSKIASKWELGPLAEAFPVSETSARNTNWFRETSTLSPRNHPLFGNVGRLCLEDSSCSSRVMVNVFWSTKAKPEYDGEKMTIRENIMVQKGEADYDESYEVDKAELKKGSMRKAREAIEFRIRKADLEKYPTNCRIIC